MDVLSLLGKIHAKLNPRPSLVEFAKIESILELYIKYGYSKCMFARRLHVSFKAYKAAHAADESATSDEGFKNSIIKNWLAHTKKCDDSLL